MKCIFVARMVCEDVIWTLSRFSGEDFNFSGLIVKNIFWRIAVFQMCNYGRTLSSDVSSTVQMLGEISLLHRRFNK